jgi:cytochrome d ubiquinol oxidase subunit I
MFHISWAALSVGLSAMLVVLEGLWLKTGDEAYYRHARFWGKLFLLNFVVGVVSGVPLEFQFGTNWGRFAAATGGFFGNILGFETVMAFMLEAGFLGIMFSAFWIMVANSWWGSLISADTLQSLLPGLNFPFKIYLISGVITYALSRAVP